MAGKKNSKVKDLKPRSIKSSSREASAVKGGDAKTKASKATFHDLSFTHNVDKASPVL